MKFLQALAELVRIEATTRFGRVNFLLMVLAALFLGATANDLPALGYDILMTIGDVVTTLMGHPMHDRFARFPLERVPFWQVATFFAGGLVLCMAGTREWLKVEQTAGRSKKKKR